MRVVIADDDRSVAEVLVAFVTACGHQVVDVVTAGGLAVIQSCARHQPDLVLLDIVMPKFNGFTVCQQLVSRNRNVKVVLISGLIDCAYPSVAKCGAVAYLQKPMHFEEIRDTLAKLAPPRDEKPPTAVEENCAVIRPEEEATERGAETPSVLATATA
jgi:two-component system response regulator AlgR